MIDRLITEHTTGQVVMADGSLVERPTRILTPETAAVLRSYFRWAMHWQLEPELVCATCFDFARGSKATHQIDEQQIAIVCGCGIRFFQGITNGLLGEPIPRMVTQSAWGEGSTGDLARMTLSRESAALLRDYKRRVLEGLNLREMLRCNACFELGQPDGCEAQVLTNSIRIRCRCTERTYVGSST
ncbi:MAG: hypothetical protein ACREJC_10825 [Tepidisphaeraceae bacterium]